MAKITQDYLGYNVRTEADFTGLIEKTQKIHNLLNELKPIEDKLRELGVSIELEATTQKTKFLLDAVEDSEENTSKTQK